MSLINDALKKAQKQRTGDSPPLASMPGVGGESAAKIAKRDKPAGFNAQLLRLALAAGGLVVVLAVGGIFLFRSANRPKNLRQAPGKEAFHEATPNPDTPAPAPAGTDPAHPAGGNKPSATVPVTFSLPVAPPAPPVSSITASAGSENIPSVPVAGTPAPKPPEAAAPAPAKAEPSKPAAPAEAKPAGQQAGAVPAKLDSKSITFIENLRIAGIRASATDSKVLMNDRVYRIGDIVEHELGLKLIGITASSLTFEDERGARYTRSF